MQIARGRRLGRVNVGMRIHPNGSNVRVHTRRAYHGTSAQTVVATHRQRELTGLGVLLHHVSQQLARLRGGFHIMNLFSFLRLSLHRTKVVP